MNLEFEKQFVPFLITNPKKYVGKKYDCGNITDGKVSAMGMSMIKRDSTKLCKEAMQGFFDQIIEHKNKEKAVEDLKILIQKLFEEKLDYSYFRLAKKIGKKPSDYKTKPGHISCWEKHRQKVGQTECCAIGEFFYYLITRMEKKTKVRDVLVEYETGKEMKVSIDKKHYFALSIEKPLRTSLEVVLGKTQADAILDPNNYIRVESVRATKRNLLGFFKVDSYKETKKLKK